MDTKQAPLIVIVGETASGKSALAMELAGKLDGEIICADSWTVYKGFDIGTAKPSAADQKLVPHHLLDVANPAVGYSAAVFQRQAKQAIADISARGKVPLLVGGTGLYIDSILYDYGFLPPSDPKLRKELNTLSLEEVVARADELELDTTGIDLRNKRRVIRLIENEGVRPTKQPLRANTLVLGIPIEREVLQTKIEARIESMVAAGFVDEVKSLLQQYGPGIEPFRAPGYRAFKDYIDGQISLPEAKERFRQNDLQLAKKQRTWFRRYGYPAEQAVGQPFPAKLTAGSIDVPTGTSQSQPANLTRKSSGQPPLQQASHAARNESIHWLDNRDKLAQAVDLCTTLLNKL
jgi:tRNA dimethylallyltransferase